MIDLEWGDSHTDNSGEEDLRPNENATATDTNVNERGIETPTEAQSSHSEEGRIRRPPSWMQDYVSGEGISKDENVTDENSAFLALYIDSEPISYDEAVKSEK